MKLRDTLKISLIVLIEIIFCFTPLGTIPIVPIAATLCMVPVVIASLVFGKKIGMLLGFTFAMCSFIFFTFLAPAAPTAFLFTPFAEVAGHKGNFFSIIICFVPRIIAGITPSILMGVLNKKSNKSFMSYSVASFVGSMTNTLLFIILAFLFFTGDLNKFAIESGMVNYATASDLVDGALISSSTSNFHLPFILGMTFFTNGIPEAIICAIVCPPVVKVLKNTKNE